MNIRPDRATLYRPDSAEPRRKLMYDYRGGWGDPYSTTTVDSDDRVVDLAAFNFEQTIAADLKAGKTVLVAAHGNSLRALVKYLDGMSDDEITGLNIPTGIPLRYELDENLKPTVPGGEYLDPEAAAAGAAAVAAQGAAKH